MTRDELIKLIKKYSAELMYEINDTDLDFYVKSVNSYLSNVDDDIKNFNLSKWEKYNFEPQNPNSGLWREDEIVNNDSKDSLINAIDFENGYVVVKNEK